MVYKSYHECKREQLRTQELYSDILREKEILFMKTQPKGIKYDSAKVVGGSGVNAFDRYLLSKERKRIDERLDEVRAILDDRAKLLAMKEAELRGSGDYYDQIYVRYYVDHLTVSKIIREIPYSSTQVFRVLNIICRECGIEKPRLHRAKLGTNGTKYVVKYHYGQLQNKAE